LPLPFLGGLQVFRLCAPNRQRLGQSSFELRQLFVQLVVFGPDAIRSLIA